MAESPVSSNCKGKVSTDTSRAKLFPDIPKTTVVCGMNRGKYTNFTSPAPFEMIELDEDAFKVGGKYGKLRSDAAARMGNCRAVNEFVHTILGDSIPVKYTPKQLLLVLRESSMHPDARMLFKSAGLTDVEEELGALRFQNEQIHQIHKNTNNSKKKSNGTDDI
jgi:hypothetical protein